MNRYLTLFVLLTLGLDCSSQDVKRKTSNEIGYKESFFVLKSDNSTKHGEYVLMLNKDTIQKGFYSNGEKTGIWKYFNPNNEIEFIYDNNTNCIVSDTIGKARPPLYSEGVNRLFFHLCSEIIYPDELKEANIKGKAIISFNIDVDGTADNFHVDLGCGNLSLNDEALRVVKKIALEHPWYPAIDDKGEKIKVEFKLPVNFQII